MGMPRDLVMVRHGESEANVMQAQFDLDPAAVAPEGFFDRHDSCMRLSARGVAQAILTGRWLQAQFPDGFDRYSVSPFVRTMETAQSLGLNQTWRADDRWRERDWGEYGMLNDRQREEQFALSKKLRDQSRWYWSPPGGESLATHVCLRFRDILHTMHREMADKRLIAVTHGDMILAAAGVIERLAPRDWEARRSDPNYAMSNCQILHYSRQNPHTGEIARRLEWRRSICAWDPSHSWDNGEWVHFEPKTYTDADLLAEVASFPPLLSPELAT